MASFSNLLGLVVFMFSAIIGLLIFTRGFLLNRVAVTNATQASNYTTAVVYEKAIVLVIDALRYDFVQHQPSSNTFYHNKLPFIHTLLTEQEQQTRLYRFIADPPTTTMQRLKGLTTGGLPTFVDAGSNFASSEINEDNIIQQLVNNNKRIIFMGDDTWESLFTGRFTRSYPFPSFNVHDLHTVDRGVKRHLLPELARDEFTVVIAHFLGVDHCGHRYGPDHPAMSDKLTEMNDVIRSVVEAMDEDTLLVVLGDHGMTKTGDHGGDSDAEVNAALLVHSKRPGVWPQQQELEEVSQIDLVPTLSLLLGIPIPYSNLGSLIPELLDDIQSDDAHGKLLQALHRNQQQISNYLHHYSLISNDLPRPKMAVLEEMEQNVKILAASAVPDVQKLKRKYMDYMWRAKRMCQDVWARFDDNLMLIGSLQVVVSIVLLIATIRNYMSFESYSVLVSQCLMATSSLVLCYLSVSPPHSAILLTFLFIILFFFCASKDGSKTVNLSLVGILTIVCLALFCLSSLSNSLLVNEDTVTYFLVQSVLIFMWSADVIEFVRKEQVKTKERITPPSTYLWRIFKRPSTYHFIAITVILQLSQSFRACREEKTNCEMPLFFTPLGSLRHELINYKNLRFWFMSVPSVVVPAIAVKRILQVRGNLNGYSPVTMVTSYGLWFMSLFILLDWATSTTPLLVDWQRTLFARMLYITVSGAIVVSFITPLAVYFRSNKTQTVPYNGSIPSLYHYMKDSLHSPQSGGDERSLVYGLSSAYSATYMLVGTALALYLMMLAGDGMSASISLLVLTMFLFLDFHQITSQDHAGVSTPVVICWFLLCKHFFYCSGQQLTITNIRWDAAFHGFSDDHNNNVIPAILLFSSTFSSQILFTFSLPMLLVVTESCQSFYQSLRLPTGRSLTGIGEVALSRPDPTQSYKLRQLFSTYILAHLLKSFAALCSAAILRRHLMVWKIFAPAFIYEGASFIVTCLVSCIAYLLFIRLTTAVRKYVKHFDLDHVD